MEKNDLPDLPSIEVSFNYFKNLNLNQWKEKKEGLIYEYGFDSSPSSPILKVVTFDEPLIRCEGDDESEEIEKRNSELRGSDSFLDRNPFEMSPDVVNQNQSVSESSEILDILHPPNTSFILFTNSSHLKINEQDNYEILNLNFISNSEMKTNCEIYHRIMCVFEV